MALSGMKVLGLSAIATVVVLALQVAVLGWVVDEYVVVATPATPQLRSVTSAAKRSPVFTSELTALPVVLMHGMADAAGNSGMKHIRDLVGKNLSTYAVNIQIGNSVEEDVKNSITVTMDKQVEVFASEVRKDAKLRDGFNAVGFSQGNLIIRGYIERYNNPPVFNFVSFHGPLAGVGALPQCKPTQIVCKMIDKLIGAAVYSEKVQEHLAQANYFRDPHKIPEYLAHAKFLPDINNEKAVVNATYKTNFISLRSLVLVRANRDTQVYPKDSEWFGAYDGDYTRTLGFNETRWYREDLFGLQTLDRAGKVHFLETDGDHLQFTSAYLLEVVDKFFTPTLA